VKAIQWLSGESWPKSSSASVRREGNRLAFPRVTRGGKNPEISLGLRINLEVDNETAIPRPLSGDIGNAIRQQQPILLTAVVVTNGHWLSDVIAGAFLGASIGWMTVLLLPQALPTASTPVDA